MKLPSHYWRNLIQDRALNEQTSRGRREKGRRAAPVELTNTDFLLDRFCIKRLAVDLDSKNFEFWESSRLRAGN